MVKGWFGWVLVGLVVVVVALYGREQRRAGTFAALYATAKHERDSLARRGVQIRQEFIRDTTAAKKARVVYLDAKAKVDTQFLHDTVPVPVEVVREVVAAADTTIKACFATVSTCSLALANADAEKRALVRQIRLLEKRQPSALRRWSERLVWGAGGYVVGRALAR